MLTVASEFLQVHSSKGVTTATVLKESCYRGFTTENVTGILSLSWTLSSSSDGKTILKTILKLPKLLPSVTGTS